MTKTEINFMVTIGLLLPRLRGLLIYEAWLVNNLMKGRKP